MAFYISFHIIPYHAISFLNSFNMFFKDDFTGSVMISVVLGSPCLLVLFSPRSFSQQVRLEYLWLHLNPELSGHLLCGATWSLSSNKSREWQCSQMYEIMKWYEMICVKHCQVQRAPDLVEWLCWIEVKRAKHMKKDQWTTWRPMRIWSYYASERGFYFTCHQRSSK